MENSELDQPFSPVDILQNERRSTRANVITSLEDDPEAAARAQTLAENTGAHPALVHSDVEGFEAQYKTSLVSKLLNDNKYLAEYANSHPLAAKISNDDWGNLDAVSSALHAFSGPVGLAATAAGTKIGQSVLAKAFQGFKDNFDAPSIQAEQQKLAEALQASPMFQSVAGNPLFGYVTVEQATKGAGLGMEVALKGFTGLIGGAAAGVGELAKQLGSNEAEADRLTRDLIVWANVAMAGQHGLFGLKGRPISGLEKEIQKFQEFHQVVEPYLKAGVEPPYGLHEVVDKMKERQSKLDLDNLSDALKEAQASNTRERNPDMFAGFVRQHTDTNIGISADAVRKLYGDKPPLADDNLLGFVPRLAEQLTLAEMGGGDIQVSLAYWLAKVDPALAKDLHDDIRVRPGGVTKNEVKEAAEVRKVKADLEAFHGSPHEFDAFSMEKIGTGEGAQSYGHGLYFAENPEVAKSYAVGRQTGGTFKAGGTGPFADVEMMDVKPPTQYRVRIKADKEQFLDWDKPYSEQSPHVQEVLERLGFPKDKLSSVSGRGIHELLANAAEEKLLGERYDALIKPLPKLSQASERVAQTLREAGIPGIKYLDQGSRIPPQVVADTLSKLNEAKKLSAEFPKDENLAAIVKDQQKLYDDAKAGIKPETHNFVLFDDSLVEIIAKNDQAVVATRKAAALDTTLDKIVDKTFDDLHDKLQRGYDYTRGGVFIRIVPKEQLLAKEKEIHKAMLALRDRIAGKSVGLKIADYVGLSKDRESQGLYQSFDKIAPVIFYSTKASNIPDTVRHEVIHFLRDYNFLSKKEWGILEREAESKGWLEKHQISDQYGGQGLNRADLLEEAIAKEYGEWGSTTAKAEELTAKYSKEAGATFQKIKDILAQIKDAIKEIFGHSPDVAELFEKIESGEVAKRGPGKPSAGSKDLRANQFELPQAGTTRMAERELFTKASAIGMTVDQYKRYMKLIEKRRTEDQTAIAEIALKEERKHQTQEWKDNSAVIRGEVAADINQRPDIAADEFLRAGGHKLSSEGLTDEQVVALPKKLVGPDGVRADDIAGFFGYTTGSQLVDRLVQLNQARDAAGMKPEAYRRRIIEAETERRMQAKFGDLDRNIIEEAKEHVLSETQMDLLHEETLALGMKNDLELSFTKEDVRKGIQKEFDNTVLRNVDSDASLAAAGRAGRAAEMHHLKEEWGDAFKYKQQQYYAIQTARLAKGLEKAREQFDRTAKRFSAREVPQVEQEYTNFIHDILMRTGQRVKRSVQDLADSLARGEQKTLEDFVDYKQGHDMREVPVAEFLLDGGFRKNLEDLTVKEFNDLHDSIKTLVKNGRDEKKINKAGEEADLADVKAKMIEQLQEFKEKHYDAEGKRWLGPIPPVVARPMRTFLASVLQIESIFNRWDRGDPRGVFTQYVSRELSVAANFEASLERKYSRLLGDIADKADLKAKIANDLFNDPFSRTDTDPGVPIQMTRKNLRAILLNAGNASNLDKLARGYHVKPEQVMQWLHQTATKEDWDWAQKMGNIFAEIKKEADTMYRGLSGIEPENIPVEPITTPHGEYPGWYYPVVYHPVWEGKSKKLMGGDALEQENYVRATTPRGYTKSRTGYAAPLDLSLDQAPVRMKQMIHDIAFRPAVINASKIFYDQQIRQAVTKHYGVEYSKLLVPYLRDVANSANFRSDAASVGANVSEFIRQNIIATLIGLNPGTVMKHGPTAAINSLTEVGPTNFAKAVKGLFSVNDATGETNWTFAMTTSEELGRRHRHWNETLGGATQKIQDESSIRNMVMKLGAYPVAMSDLLSAVPTWLAKYESEMRLGTDHGESVFLADRAVRRAHGSSVVTNRPALMRGGPLASWLTSLYGFFNHILNRQYELMWKAGDTVDLVKAGEWKEASKNSPELMAGLFSYILFPALVEEMVTPLSNDQHESWGKKAAKAVGFTLGSSWPIVRDVVAAALHGRDPSAGLLSTAGKTVTDIARDLSKGGVAFNKAHAGQLIQHGVTMFGGLTGLANAQIGKSGRFIYDYSTGMARPKGFGDWWKGLRKGTLKETH